MDRWLLVHLVSGIAGGFSNVLFGLGAGTVLLLATALMLLWEVGEAIGGIRETWPNRAIDVGVGLLGTVAALVVAARVGPVAERWLFGATAIASAGLSFLGFSAYRRRGKR